MLPTYGPSRKDFADGKGEAGDAISRYNVHSPAGGNGSSDAVGTEASGQISTSHKGAADDVAALGQQDCSSDYGGVPEINSLQISPKAAKDSFGSGFARSSQRGQKQHRPNPYNRPHNTPHLRKSSSRDSKSDEEKDL